MADLQQWVDDLQDGMYINCVYCGHRYGPKETEVLRDTLKQHIVKCPEHPLGKLINICKCVITVIGIPEYGEMSSREQIVYESLKQAVREAEK